MIVETVPRFPERNEVKSMRRTLMTPAALLAAAALALAGCSGESPTGPKTDGSGGGGGGGACNVQIQLAASSYVALAGQAVLLRATVTQDGKPVPDGTSILFTADTGIFVESGLPSVSKVTQNGYADVYYGAVSAGIGKPKATYQCASATVSIQFDGIPTQGPYISSLSPTSGGCAGGDTVVINGGRFTGVDPLNPKLLVTFGGAPASIVLSSDAQITVLTPARTLAGGATSETVDVIVTVDAGTAGQQRTPAKKFTYSCAPKAVQVAYVVPSYGKPAGGETVTVGGNNFAPDPSVPSSSLPARTRVTFGGLPAVIQTVTNTSISVLTPKYTLVDPSIPEAVDVAVTADLGLPTQSLGTLPKGFTYTNTQNPGSDPVIFSISPSAGPRDTSTRVTIFGQNFAFPSQVFFGTAEAAVVSIKATEIVVLSPQATGANSGLVGPVDVLVRNPATGLTATSPVQFTYYACPTGILGISPATVPFDQTTKVAITGNGFEEPLEVTMTLGTTAPTRVTVVSVSASTLIVEIPPLAALPGGASASCANVPILLSVTSLRAGCGPLTNTAAPFAYEILRPTITSVSPSSMPQTGGQTVTVTGTNFKTPMTVTVGGTTVNATVASAGVLTFVAPPVGDASFLTQPCGPGGLGSQRIPTSFDVRVTNPTTSCAATAPAAIVYQPTDTTCTLAISTVTLPSATLCSAYSAQLQAGGGTPPYSFQAVGALPNGLTLSIGGLLSGTPALPAAGAGGSTTASVTIQAFDSVSATATKTFPLSITDPGGPFAISPISTTITLPVGGSSVFTAGPGIGAISWPTATTSDVTLVTVTPAGNQVTIARVAAGSVTVNLVAQDSSCGGVPHTASRILTVN